MRNSKSFWITAWIFIGLGAGLILIPLAVVIAQYFTYDSVNNSAPAGRGLPQPSLHGAFWYHRLILWLVLLPRLEKIKKAESNPPAKS
jgi:hypothetical protein